VLLAPSSVDSPKIPLVVDLDGTLLRSDLLVESFAGCLSESPLAAVRALFALRRGKEQMKSILAHAAQIDPSSLPYDADVLATIEEARNQGCPVYLASAGHARFVEAVASHLGLFDGWFASDESINLAGSEKARVLEKEFGKGGFDYIGNDRADLAVWQSARNRIAIRLSPRVTKLLTAIDADAVILSQGHSNWKSWLKLLRVHQYVKNVLVFVPLMTSHTFEAHALVMALAAFVSFSLCASAVYVLNDLIDIQADRTHPSKSKRPLAAGTVPILQAGLVAPLLLVISFGLAALVLPSLFVLVLASYLALTTAYTFSLKRKMLVDVVVLAMLYTVRVIAGGAAVGVDVSEWLLAFSMFLFTSLALVKRFIELLGCVDANRPGPANRNYQAGDVNIVAALAAASGFNAVTVLALYISSDAVQALYVHPQWLWLICPIMIYWIARVLLMAQRRLLDDDPIVFAMKDRNSLVAGLLILLITAAATF